MTQNSSYKYSEIKDDGLKSSWYVTNFLTESEARQFAEEWAQRVGYGYNPMYQIIKDSDGIRVHCTSYNSCD
jgi:hypothetical protein